MHYHKLKTTNYSEFLKFLHNVPFLFQNPMKDTTLILSWCLPASSWLWHFFRLSFLWMILTPLGSSDQYFVGCTKWGFLRGRLGLGVFRRKITEAKCYSHHTIWRVLMVNRIFLFMLSLNGWLKCCVSRFSHHKDVILEEVTMQSMFIWCSSLGVEREINIRNSST